MSTWTVEPVFGLSPHRDGYGAAADRSKRVWANHCAAGLSVQSTKQIW